MVNKIIFACLWALSKCQSDKTATSCLKKNPNYYGKSEGLEVSDWTYLNKNESPDFTFKLTDIAMCTTSTDVLLGLQTRVGKFKKVSGELTGYQMLSEFGQLRGKCKSISLQDGEYVTTVNINFDDKSIKKIIVLTSKDQMFSAGKETGLSSESVKVMKFSE